jgi:hypothetical protein
MSNMVFIQATNGVCNNAVFSPGTISGMEQWDNEDMHEATRRLAAVAFAMRGIASPTGLATALNMSAQVVTNWKRRGPSVEGALAAQREFGCDANWVLTGEGFVLAGWPFTGQLLQAVREQIRLDARFSLEVENTLRGRLHLPHLDEVSPPTILAGKQAVAGSTQALQLVGDSTAASRYPASQETSTDARTLRQARIGAQGKDHGSQKHQRSAHPKGGSRS